MADLVEEKSTPPKGKTFPLRDRVPGRKRKLGRYLVLFLFLAILAVGGYYLWRYFSTYETTDDAQIDGNINPISARISGYIIGVLVEDQQRVKAGDVLVAPGTSCRQQVKDLAGASAVHPAVLIRELLQ